MKTAQEDKTRTRRGDTHHAGKVRPVSPSLPASRQLAVEKMGFPQLLIPIANCFPQLASRSKAAPSGRFAVGHPSPRGRSTASTCCISVGFHLLFELLELFDE